MTDAKCVHGETRERDRKTRNIRGRRRSEGENPPSLEIMAFFTKFLDKRAKKFTNVRKFRILSSRKFKSFAKFLGVHG